MKLIRVAPIPGRIAFASATGGRVIDKPMTVPETAWLRRLIDVHGDIEEVPMTAAPKEKLAASNVKAA
jgi:hypothetical protein